MIIFPERGESESKKQHSLFDASIFVHASEKEKSPLILHWGYVCFPCYYPSLYNIYQAILSTIYMLYNYIYYDNNIHLHSSTSIKCNESHIFLSFIKHINIIFITFSGYIYIHILKFHFKIFKESQIFFS